jgi:hypothetical protein
MTPIEAAAKAAFDHFARVNRYKGLKWEDTSAKSQAQWLQMAHIVISTHKKVQNDNAE